MNIIEAELKTCDGCKYKIKGHPIYKRSIGITHCKKYIAAMWAVSEGRFRTEECIKNNSYEKK